MAIPQHDADLARGRALLGQLADLVLDLIGSDLKPGGWRAGVGDGGLGYAFAVGVEASHLVLFVVVRMFDGVVVVRSWEVGGGGGGILRLWDYCIG